MIDLLLVGGTILTVDPNDTVLSSGALAVHDGLIVDVGSPEELRARYRARVTLERTSAVILPGWINTHAHMAMHAFRGLTEDVNLQEFLDVLIEAELQLLSEETVRVGVRAAIADAIKGGVTTALDMYWYPRVARAVARDAGFRLLNGPTFLGETDPEGREFDGVLADAERQLQEAGEDDSELPLWVMPHSAYTLSADQLASIAALAKRYDARINTHACESTDEIDAVMRRHTQRPIEVLDRAGLLGATTTLAHSVHLTDEEITTIAHRGASVAHCPVSNLKLGCGIAPVGRLRDAGVLVSVGTDGAASGGALDMFENIRLAALVAKGSAEDPTVLTARDVVRMATADAATSLGLKHVGHLAPGMAADIQIVGTTSLHTMSADPYAAVAYAAHASDVLDVVIGGRVVLRDRRLLTLDYDAVSDDLENMMRDLATRVTRQSSPTAIGAATQNTGGRIDV